VGNLYDLTQPGTYTMQVALIDPATHLTVKSNPISVTMVGPSETAQNDLPRFLLGLEAPYGTVRSGSKLEVYLYLVSALDHPVDLAAQTNNLQVLDASGNPAPLTEEGK